MLIDVFHDTACPWCRIGKAHMKAAIAQWAEPVEVRYHTFFLSVFNNRLAFSGAQPTEVFLQAMEQARALNPQPERRSATP